MTSGISKDDPYIPFRESVVKYSETIYIVGGRGFYVEDGWVIDKKNNNRNHIETLYGRDVDIRTVVWGMFELRNCRDCINCIECSDCRGCTNCHDCHRCSYCDNCANLRDSKDCVNCASSTNCDDCAGCIWVEDQKEAVNLTGTNTIGYKDGEHIVMREEIASGKFPFA